MLYICKKNIWVKVQIICAKVKLLVQESRKQLILKRLGTKLKKLKPKPVRTDFRCTEVDGELKFL